MAITGGYTDALRALGRFLDSVGACEIGVVERAGEVFVSWSDRGTMRHERRLQAAELDAIRAQARLYRGLGGRSQRFTVGELLRTLGMILDEMEATSMSITETADGFRLSLQIGEERMARAYTYTDLVHRAQQGHRQRTVLPAKRQAPIS